jgi:hypothetical protein
MAALSAQVATRLVEPQAVSGQCAAVGVGAELTDRMGQAQRNRVAQSGDGQVSGHAVVHRVADDAA